MFEIIMAIVGGVLIGQLWMMSKALDRLDERLAGFVVLPEDEAEEYDCRDCFECYPDKCDEFTECKYGDGGVRCVGCERCGDGGSGDE